MVSTSGVGSSTPTDASQIDFAEKSGYQSLTTEDFVKLLVTQLQNQNPMDPMKDSDLTQQVSAIQSLNSTSQLISTLDSFGQNQNLGAAANLIGREVTGKVDNKDVTGIAGKAIVEDGKVYIMVGEDKVPFDTISSVGSGSSEDSESSSLDAISNLLKTLTGNSDSSSSGSTDGTSASDQAEQLLNSLQNQTSDSTGNSSSGGSGSTTTEQDLINALESMATTGGSS